MQYENSTSLNIKMQVGRMYYHEHFPRQSKKKNDGERICTRTIMVYNISVDNMTQGHIKAKTGNDWQRPC